MRSYICKQCGKNFVGKESNHIYKFCSKKCGSESYRGKICPNRKEKILRKGYWHFYLPDNAMAGKQGYVAEHRLIMSEHLGRPLKNSEIVHHINENITDNRIENLVIKTLGEHLKEHNKIDGWSRKFSKCIQCGTTKIHHEAHGKCYKCYNNLI